MPGAGVVPAVRGELERQLTHELGAAQGYLGMWLWCEAQNLKGLARFFKKQHQEEREHAEKFMKHLLDRGELPNPGALPPARVQYASLMEVALEAQRMERANTAGITAAYEAALAQRDYPAQVLLQWFINEQVEEERWADELVVRVERAQCPGGLAELDRHVERHLEE